MVMRDFDTLWDRKTYISIKENFKELFNYYIKSGLDAAEAREKAIQAVTDAAIAKETAEVTREEMLAIIREQTQNGDLAPEIAQARQGKETLGDNLNSIKSDLAQTMNYLNDLYYNVTAFGVKNDRSENALPIIKDLIQTIPDNAGLFFPAGDYLWQGEGTELLLIERRVNLLGNNAKIVANPVNTGETDIIRITPSKGWSGGSSTIEGLHFTSGGGTRARDIIKVVIGSYGVMNLTIRNNQMLNVDGKSVNLINPTHNDGFFMNDIVNNTANVGMYFERIGDTNRIARNNMFGKGVAFEVSSVPGALSSVFEYNNITSEGGAIKITSGGQLKFLYNQCEQVSTYTGDVGALVYIAGTLLPEIRGNNLNGHNNVDRIIRIGSGTIGAIIDANYLQRSAATNMILIDEGAIDTQILPTNKYLNSRGSLVSPRIKNTGKGTETPVLNDGWVIANETWQYSRPNRINIPEDTEIKYSRGDKIKFSQGGTEKYFYVIRVHSATELEIYGGSDYLLADQTITENYYSKAETPRGFPEWFNHNPTYTGFATMPESICRFKLSGKMCTVVLNMKVAGESNVSNFQVSAPVPSNGAYETYSHAFVHENDTNNPTTGYVRTQEANNSFLFCSIPYSGFRPNGNKRASFSISYEIQ